MIIPLQLAEALFAANSEESIKQWLLDVDRTVGGLLWRPVGGIGNNVHTVEVASDPALALVLK
jgi:hypothetical protein